MVRLSEVPRDATELPVAVMELDRDLLATYLNDHLAGATAVLELARRARGSNQGTLGTVLRGLVEEIESDRDELGRVMERLDLGRDRLKTTAAWFAEKLGRLKLNGRLLGYSPLSRLVEVEVLLLGVNGKMSLWRTLRELAALEPRLDDFDFDRLLASAGRQREKLERQRSLVAASAFGG